MGVADDAYHFNSFAISGLPCVWWLGRGRGLAGEEGQLVLPVLEGLLAHHVCAQKVVDEVERVLVVELQQQPLRAKQRRLLRGSSRGRRHGTVPCRPLGDSRLTLEPLTRPWKAVTSQQKDQFGSRELETCGATWGVIECAGI